MPVRRMLLNLFAIVGLLASPSGHVAMAAASIGQVLIAVAANFIGVAQLLTDHYASQTGNRIEISAASTGKLYAQIRHGAPFDVLLAADNTTSQRLVDERLAVRSSQSAPMRRCW